MNQQEIDWQEGEKLIGYIVNRIAVRLPSHIEAEDLHSVGVIGLIDAANKFNPDKGCKFSTYAEHRIKGAILDQLRGMDWVPRGVRQKARKLERAYAEVEQTLGRAANDDEVANFLDIAADEFHALRKQASALSLLSINAERSGPAGGDRSRGEILEDHKAGNQFAALNQSQTVDRIAAAIGTLSEREHIVVSLYYYEDLNMKEIGAILGVSESRVCQIHTKATANLRDKLTS